MSQALNVVFPIGTQVEAFHSGTLTMEAGTVAGYLQDVSCAPYALVVTFSDSSVTREFYYRAYVDADNSARSLVNKIRSDEKETEKGRGKKCAVFA